MKKFFKKCLKYWIGTLLILSAIAAFIFLHTKGKDELEIALAWISITIPTAILYWQIKSSRYQNLVDQIRVQSAHFIEAVNDNDLTYLNNAFIYKYEKTGKNEKLDFEDLHDKVKAMQDHLELDWLKLKLLLPQKPSPKNLERTLQNLREGNENVLNEFLSILFYVEDKTKDEITIDSFNERLKYCKDSFKKRHPNSRKDHLTDDDFDLRKCIHIISDEQKHGKGLFPTETPYNANNYNEDIIGYIAQYVCDLLEYPSKGSSYFSVMESASKAITEYCEELEYLC